jgi:hypothetical protein
MLVQEPIYVTYSDELRSALAKADVDIAARIQEELAKQGIQGKVQLAPDPTSPTSEDRDVFLLILAAGVAASLVGSAVARVIDAVTQHRRTEMKEENLQVALDGGGKPIRDASGNPVYNTSSQPVPVPAAGKEKTSFSAGKLLKFEFSRS